MIDSDSVLDLFEVSSFLSSCDFKTNDLDDFSWTDSIEYSSLEPASTITSSDEDSCFLADLLEYEEVPNQKSSHRARKKQKKTNLYMPTLSKQTTKPKYTNATQNFLLLNDMNELTQAVYEAMDTKCLFRFKIAEISARTGPEHFIEYFNLKRKAFPIATKDNIKFKQFSIDQFIIVKSKSLVRVIESTYDDTYAFFSNCFNAKDLLHLKGRKNNFIPNEYTIQVITTRYIDINTEKIVLFDIGYKIKSRKPIKIDI